ncbi:MAG: DUF4190 domain-containing protein [Lachnospiraceae bacterium]
MDENNQNESNQNENNLNESNQNESNQNESNLNESNQNESNQNESNLNESNQNENDTDQNISEGRQDTDEASQDLNENRQDAQAIEGVQPVQMNYYAQQNRPPVQNMNQGNGFAIASMVLGIVSLVLFCTCLNFATAMLAVVFGIIHLTKKGAKRGMAIAGLITAGLSILFGLVFWILLLVNGAIFSTMSDTMWNDIYQYEQEFDYENPIFEDDGTF